VLWKITREFIHEFSVATSNDKINLLNIKTINMKKGRFRRPNMHKSQALILKCNNNGGGDVGGLQGLIMKINLFLWQW